MPLKGEFGSLQIFSIGWMPGDRNLAYPRRKPCDPDVCPSFRSFSAAATRVVEPAWVATPPRRVSGLGFVAQPSNSVVFW
jgi:hypothetical protein